jgi:hypothetical protein
VNRLRPYLGWASLAVLLCATLAFGQAGVRTRGAKLVIERTGDISITPVSGKKTVVTGQFAPFSTKTALTPGATVAVNAALGDFFTLTPGEDETLNVTGGSTGQILCLLVTTSGATSRTLTFGTNFVSQGTLATGTTTAKRFMVKFLFDGTNFIEMSRTAAM